MILTSYEFILFLIATIVLYYVLPKKAQWILLLVGSYGFYFYAGAVSEGGLSVKSGLMFIGILFATTLLTYQAGIRIDKANAAQIAYLSAHKDDMSREEKKAYRKKNDRKKVGILLTGLLTSLAILLVFKYSEFAVDNINAIIWKVNEESEGLSYLNLLLPMGISFYTFQSLGYLIDVYWEKVPAEKNLAKYMLFVSFFPQLIQGPISRHSDLAKQLYEPHKFSKKNLKFGLERVLYGFFKKLVIADTISVAVQGITCDEYYNGVWVVVAMAFWAIQLYADFTGGIDITIGIAEILGIRLEENFIRPFFSKGIVEYWRRWHITMGSWFRDYIFYPMSISKGLNKLTTACRKHIGKGFGKRVAVYICTMVAWFATGVWHGASWNYIVWGVMNGVIILITGELEPLYQKFRNKFPKLVASRGYALFQVVRTVILMSCLRLFDIYQDVPTAFSMFGSIFKDFDINALQIQDFVDFGLTKKQYLAVAIGVVIMIIVSLIQRRGSVRQQLEAKPIAIRLIIFGVLFVAVIVFGTYGFGYDAAGFIYNRF